MDHLSDGLDLAQAEMLKVPKDQAGRVSGKLAAVGPRAITAARLCPVRSKKGLVGLMMSPGEEVELILVGVR